MDPQSVVFQPQSDNNWRLREELQRIQSTQAEHSDRLLRIERRVEDDARMKSVWGGASPFPGVLSGTPQQTPLQQPSAEVFKHFDDESTALIGSLHLDAEDEPRRMGATSRANSVRFDESANQGHWSHASRSSMDLIRSGGGVPMGERSLSHKSEGRASSVHSIRSAASGRMNSLNLESTYSFGDSGRSPAEHTGLAPGLLLLGSVPAIIRCWMDTNFKHDALYYAAICTGSHKSLIDKRLLDKLGFSSRITPSQTIALPVYFPEAVPHPASSRSSSPAPQLPTLTATFTVLPASISSGARSSKCIQIIIGSDVLRLHNADIMFSSNSMSILDDDRNKLSIPLVRPEDQRTFNELYTASDESHLALSTSRRKSDAGEASLSGLGQREQSSGESLPSVAAGLAITSGKSPGANTVNQGSSGLGASYSSDDDLSIPTRRSIRFAQDIDTVASPKHEPEDAKDLHGYTDNQSSKPSTPLNWGNWRQREPEGAVKPATMDYANASKGREPIVARKESGMKVLRPMRSSSRTTSSSTANSYQPPQDGKSRFFDDGKRRTNADAPISLQSPVSTTHVDDSKAGSQVSAQGKINPANPAGGASAFSWLKQGGAK